jgi:MarR family
MFARQASAADVDLSQPSYVLLRTLIDEGPLPMGALARIAHMDMGMATRQVSGLVETGLVTRELSYTGFHLGNLWGESLDYGNHVTSLNGFQAEPDADGMTRYVVAHADPGVPNWFDTTVAPRGL